MDFGGDFTANAGGSGHRLLRAVYCRYAQCFCLVGGFRAGGFEAVAGAGILLSGALFACFGQASYG